MLSTVLLALFSWLSAVLLRALLHTHRVTPVPVLGVLSCCSHKTLCESRLKKIEKRRDVSVPSKRGILMARLLAAGAAAATAMAAVAVAYRCNARCAPATCLLFAAKTAGRRPRAMRPRCPAKREPVSAERQLFLTCGHGLVAAEGRGLCRKRMHCSRTCSKKQIGTSTHSFRTSPARLRSRLGRSCLHNQHQCSHESGNPFLRWIQVSMTASSADVEGRTPAVQPSKSPANSSALFLRRQASASGKEGVAVSPEDDVAIPGSLAVTSAQVDGGSPRLVLSPCEDGTLLGRRSARGTPVTTPTQANGAGTRPVSVWSPGASPKQPQLVVEEEDTGTIMTATASDLDSQNASPSLALGADSTTASIFNRRKSQKAECDLNSTTTLSAIEGAQTQLTPPAETSSLLEKRRLKREQSAEGGGMESLEPQTLASFAISGAGLHDEDAELKLCGKTTTLLQRRESMKEEALAAAAGSASDTDANSSNVSNAPASTAAAKKKKKKKK